MTVEIIVFIFGGLLLVIGLLGGGLEIKELKIPKVGMDQILWQRYLG
jgi:hypothetical protein